MGPFVNSVACLQKDHKKYPNLFCFVWLVNPEDSEKGLDIFWVWISEEIQTFGFLLTPLCQAHDKNSSTNKICLNYTMADFIT